jgi:hypothetical protein
MPSTQRGQVVKLAGSWGARWYDDNGERQRQAGFATKSAARQWLGGKVDEVNAGPAWRSSRARQPDLVALGALRNDRDLLGAHDQGF